ncbi:hypothetical protein [Marinagarivorans cellulosilyticus]|uniref:DUF5689 domain-containing protein n=1 Tax=Marinagarivorans cellulosilyticus TaxID=2721545 RepID=A0AAN1WJR2_9GAMM|nr:hypothetical protein [Marinagarivorans cellulosilyticus]BCD98840.1 hypothetical protein MARGE09_P3041 [Marinagarivorans cellulosilyticus]
MAYFSAVSHILLMGCFSLLVACGGKMGAAGDSVASGSSASSELSEGYLRLAPSIAMIDKSRFCAAPAALGTRVVSFRFERDFLQQQLLGEGLVGTVHGVMSINQQAVFTYRSDTNFFDAEELSLVPNDGQVAGALASVGRHDRIRIQGNLLQTGDGPRHVLVEALEVLEPYATRYDYNYRVDETLFEGVDRAKILAQVHAIVDGGKGLVLEHEDMVLPVIVDASHQALSAALYRNDIVLIDVSIIRADNRPLHFRTDAAVVDALQRVDAMVGCHNREVVLQGALVRFAASPAISRDVYAVKVSDANGIARIYTLFPGIGFEDPAAFNALFSALSEKAQAAWQANLATAVAGRNYFVNPVVQVNVAGRINVTTANQANPQLYVDNVEQLEFSVGE